MRPLVDRSMIADVAWGTWSSEADVRVGGLVLVSSGGDLLIMHRIVDMRSGPAGLELLQMADNLAFGNPLSAGWMRSEHVLGVVQSLRTPDGRIRYQRSSPSWRQVDTLMATSARVMWSRHARGYTLRASALRAGRKALMSIARRVLPATTRRRLS